MSARRHTIELTMREAEALRDALLGWFSYHEGERLDRQAAAKARVLDRVDDKLLRIVMKKVSRG